jgi:hypothetical protein
MRRESTKTSVNSDEFRRRPCRAGGSSRRPSTRDADGNTAAMLARTAGREKVAALLDAAPRTPSLRDLF